MGAGACLDKRESLKLFAFPMSLIPLAVFYARYRYIAYRIYLRFKMGKCFRDEYLRDKKLRVLDFLPQIPYNANGIKVVLRKGTHDYYMFFPGGQQKREHYVREHLTLNEREVFVDVGANVGAHSLRVADNYAHMGVRVIAIEAEPEAYKTLVQNIKRNNLTNIDAIKVAVSDHKGSAVLHERSYDGVRIGTGLHSILNTAPTDGNFIVPNGKTLQIECDKLDNIISSHGADVMKIDVEGAEIMALEGATKVLKQLRKIIVEIHDKNLERVKEILESNNFTLEIGGPAGQYVTGIKQGL